MKKRVLIVDDEVEIVKYLSQRLEREDYEPIIAYDGSDVMEMIAQSCGCGDYRYRDVRDRWLCPLPETERIGCLLRDSHYHLHGLCQQRERVPQAGY